MVVPYIQVIAFAVVFCRRDCEGFIHEQLVAGVVLLRHQIYYNVVFPVFPCGIVDYLYPAESFRAEVFYVCIIFFDAVDKYLDVG